MSVYESKSERVIEKEKKEKREHIETGPKSAQTTITTAADSD